MKKKIGLMVAFICILANLVAFDGNRKGFLLGFGGGVSSVSYKQEVEFFGETIKGPSVSEYGFVTDFKIGYSPANHIEFYYTSKTAWINLSNTYGDDIVIADGVGCIGFSYFIEPKLKSGEWHPSFFLSGGVGLSSWSAPLDSDIDDSYKGVGAFLGFGYELAKHYRISMEYFVNNPSDDTTYGTATTYSEVLMITFSGLAF
jgi:hypothetical protein